jgi:hypothetical protein
VHGLRRRLLPIRLHMPGAGRASACQLTWGHLPHGSLLQTRGSLPNHTQPSDGEGTCPAAFTKWRVHMPQQPTNHDPQTAPQPCDGTCKTCTGPSAGECASCNSPRELQGTACSCPQATFGASCDACDASCASCEGAATTCTSCAVNYYFVASGGTCGEWLVAMHLTGCGAELMTCFDAEVPDAGFFLPQPMDTAHGALLGMRAPRSWGTPARSAVSTCSFDTST